MRNFEVKIASIPTRENLVAEIFYQHVQWVEISQETGDFIITFYNSFEGNGWQFPLDEALEALETAKNKLIEVG